MYLLSTRVFADLVSRNPDRSIFGWLTQNSPGPSDLFASVISFGIIAASIEGLERGQRAHWRRLLAEGQRTFMDKGMAIPVDVPIVETWSSDLRAFDLLDEGDDGERAQVGEDERLVIATAIARRLTLISPPTQYLEAICDRTTLTVANP